MAKSGEADNKPNGGGAPDPGPAFDDSEFFTSEGITDDDEKDAIRSRARVLRYAEWRKTKESAPPPKSKKKPWYKGE